MMVGAVADDPPVDEVARRRRAFGAVIAQGVLGGLTVLFLSSRLDLDRSLPLAEIFGRRWRIALFTSPGWIEAISITTTISLNRSTIPL